VPSRPVVILLSLLGVCAVGVADFWSNAQITFSLIYLFPIAVAAWFVGARFAILLSGLSVVVWLATDAAGGQDIRTYVYFWNAVISLSFYAFVVLLLMRLHRLQIGLEARIQERANALTVEVRERERLERELLQVSEREQRRIGQDLHDSLCQHLTATALASQVLAEKLAARGMGEADDSRRIVYLLEEGIALSRSLAKGLHPVELQADGLMQALEEFAATTSDLFGMSCRFHCDSPVLIRAPEVATHLFRIAQEAVGNALKHGHAKLIVITLEALDSGLLLSVEDNGIGLPVHIPPSGGMGMRIMRNRAEVIGAAFDVMQTSSGGTRVSCVMLRDDEYAGVGRD
jgi:signal transduction histidine kinase